MNKVFNTAPGFAFHKKPPGHETGRFSVRAGKKHSSGRKNDLFPVRTENTKIDYSTWKVTLSEQPVSETTVKVLPCGPTFSPGNFQITPVSSPEELCSVTKTPLS